jgi:hypothetical protein
MGSLEVLNYVPLHRTRWRLPTTPRTHQLPYLRLRYLQTTGPVRIGHFDYIFQLRFIRGYINWLVKCRNIKDYGP